MIGNKTKEIEVPLRVAHDAGELVNLKQTQVTMIVLDAFLLQLGALLRGEPIVFAALFRAQRALLVIGEKRLATVRTQPVRATGHLHLQNAKVDPQLQLLATIQAEYLAHLDGARFVRPILQDRVQVQTHLTKKHRIFNVRLSIMSRFAEN